MTPEAHLEAHGPGSSSKDLLVTLSSVAGVVALVFLVKKSSSQEPTQPLPTPTSSFGGGGGGGGWASPSSPSSPGPAQGPPVPVESPPLTGEGKTCRGGVAGKVGISCGLFGMHGDPHGPPMVAPGSPAGHGTGAGPGTIVQQ